VTSAILSALSIVVLLPAAEAADWSRFRGPNGGGSAAADRPQARSGHLTPILHHPEGGELQIVVPGSFFLTGYSAATGDRLWWVSGLSFEMKSTPAVEAGVLFINGYAMPMNEEGQHVRLELFADLVQTNDADGDGLISISEALEGLARDAFSFFDLGGDGAIVAQEPDDFSTDYAAMRQRNDWVRSAFDFETLQILASSDAKVHCAIDFQRFNSGGVPYMRGRVFYILTRQDGHWGLQVRTGFPGGSMAGEASAEALQGARQAVLDFFTAFNAGDVDGVSKPLNYPHVFLAGGGVRAAPDATSPSVRPNFERMREAQGWHRSSIESLEASHVSENKVHFDLVFSRWYPDGSRYLTIPALWILTRSGDHWGIQLRSLMPPTFSSQ
jgi:hypothetical protein